MRGGKFSDTVGNYCLTKMTEHEMGRTYSTREGDVEVMHVNHKTLREKTTWET
jgi:hypothetical protein